MSTYKHNRGIRHSTTFTTKTTVQHIEGHVAVTSNSSVSNKSLKLNVNLEDICSDVDGDTGSSPVAKVDSRTKQHIKLGNLPYLTTGITSSSPVSGEKLTKSQKK